jgi:hypothetical protein
MGTKKEIKIKGGKSKMYVNAFGFGVICGCLTTMITIVVLAIILGKKGR